MVLNCGATSLVAATFQSSNGRLILKSLSHEPLNYDYSAEEQWVGAVRASLAGLVKRSKLSSNARVILPGNLLLTKTIKVPSVEKSRQSQMIAYEAANNIPYPLTEVVWDHEIVEDDGVESEVLIILVQNKDVFPFCHTIIKSGISPDCISPASILDYNAYRYAFPGQQPETLMLNLGPRSLNLLFISDTGLYINSLTLGTNTLMQNVADRLGRPFRDAVLFVRESGNPDFEASMDPGMGQVVNDCIDAYQKRIGQEISRRIVNFRRQKSGPAPKRILLTGEGVALTGLAESLSASQKISVEYFDPLANVEISPEVDQQAVSSLRFTLSEVIGEAASVPLGEDNSVHVDLMPKTLADEMRFATQKPFICIAALILALASLFPFLYFNSQKSAVEEQNKALTATAAPLRTSKEQIEDARYKTKVVRQKISKVETLANTRSNWVAFISGLQDSLQAVSHAWIEELEVNSRPNGRAEVRVAGRLLVLDFDEKQYDGATVRVNELKESFLKSPFLRGVRSESYDTNVPRILGFDFTFTTNPDKPL